MKKTLFSVMLALLAMFSLFVPKVQAYADNTYTVTFYDTSDAVISSDTVSENGFVTKPSETADEGYITLWYTSSERSDIYNFSTPVTADVNLYAKVVSASTVTYYKRATSYVDGTTASEYEVYSSMRVVSGSFISLAEAETLTGYTFSHWSLDFNGEAFDNYNTKVNSDISLYPVYNVQSFNVDFYSDGVISETKKVNYNGLVTPPTVSKQYCEFVGWKVFGGDDSDLIDFNTYAITADTRFDAVYRVVEATITISASPYFTLRETAPTTVNCGSLVILKIRLNSNYSSHTLTVDDLYITGTYTNANIIIEETAGDYTVVIEGVGSNITFNLNSLPLNEYKVTLPQVDGLDIVVTTPNSDYTLDGGVYTLKINKTFTFTTNVKDGYFAKNIDFSGCTYSSGTFSLNNKQSINIVSNCDVVKYYSLVFSGNAYATLNVTENYLQKLNSTYKFEENTTATFTITPNENYFVKSVAGASNISGTYNLKLDADKSVVLNMVEYRTLTIPVTAGIENVIVSNILEKVGNDYKIELGQTVVVTYNLSETYSNSNVTVTAADLEVVSSENSFTISNFDKSATIVYSGLEKNTYAVNALSNDMATLTASATVTHGESVIISYALKDAYNKSSLTIDNLVIDGTYYDVNISSSAITISMVTSELSIRITGLELNTYAITLTTNEFGTFETENLTFSYDADVDFTPVFTEKYTRFNLTNANILVTGVHDSVAVVNNVVTVYGATSDISIELKDLTLNRYYVKVPSVIAGQFTLSTSSTYVDYGSSFEFTLTLGAGYTQNADVLKVYANKITVAPKNVSGYSYTYGVENIVDDIYFTVSELTINSYNVVFLDTSVEPNPTISINLVNYGDTIDIISGNKDGYDFDGWYVDSDFSEIFNFNDPITKDTYIYGKYTIRMYDITFVADGITIDVITARYGEHPVDIAPNIPLKTGYNRTPAYWDFATAGLGDIVDRVATVNAVYTINKYTVKFVNQFGKTLKTEEVAHGQDAVAPTELDIQGYDFDTWDNVFTNVQDDLIVTALYNIKNYTVTFKNGNNGNVVYTKDIAYDQTIQRPEDSSVAGVGYSVYGWYTDEEMTTEYDFNSSIKGDLVLYGNIDVTMLTLRFIADGVVVKEAKVAYGSNYTEVLPEIPEKTGYNTVGWSQTSLEGITNNLDITATYEIKTYVVTFVYADGSTEEIIVKHGTTIAELPSKGQGFGKKVYADMNKLKNIDSDRTINVTIKDYNILIFVACGVLAVGLIVLVIVLSVRVKVNGTIIKENKDKAKEQK